MRELDMLHSRVKHDHEVIRSRLEMALQQTQQEIANAARDLAEGRALDPHLFVNASMATVLLVRWNELHELLPYISAAAEKGKGAARG